ncbi:MAG: hypothetical protein PWP59_1150 [Sphaerochaeta sp.]|nr:hypothetical protein [Sphaerochaeta sp.]
MFPENSKIANSERHLQVFMLMFLYDSTDLLGNGSFYFANKMGYSRKRKQPTILLNRCFIRYLNRQLHPLQTLHQHYHPLAPHLLDLGLLGFLLLPLHLSQ